MTCVAPRSGTGAGKPGASGWPVGSSVEPGIGAPRDVRCSSAMARHSLTPSARTRGAENMFPPMRSKDQVRRAVWRAMDREGVSRFPGAEGRIPNFAGAKLAAQKLAAHRLWKRAQVIKANPDSPQTHARRLALEDGKTAGDGGATAARQAPVPPPGSEATQQGPGARGRHDQGGAASRAASSRSRRCPRSTSCSAGRSP